MKIEKKIVLVIGSGAREHAIASKLSLSPKVGQVIVCPGNDGMSSKWKRWKTAPYPALAQKASDEDVDLVVIGPDAALADGAVDAFLSRSVATFGPKQAAAKIESSKAFAKEVMTAAGVPTAKWSVVKDMAEALAFFETTPWGQGFVIKADGLALGKGVRVCEDKSEAIAACEELISISGSLVIEEKLRGREISWMAFCDGERCALLEPAQDYKRLSAGDQGPNTGGMGAFSPVQDLPEDLEKRVREQVFLPTLQEMAKRGTPFKGVLYAGLMLDQASGQFFVLEFNARFGDPEAQVLLPRMKDDLYDWLAAVAMDSLIGKPEKVPFHEDFAVYVVAAAKGYPGEPEKDQSISGPILDASAYYLAGIRKSATGFVTAGGRVLGALGQGRDLAEATQRAYANLKNISFSGMQSRSDIGGRS